MRRLVYLPSPAAATRSAAALSDCPGGAPDCRTQVRAAGSATSTSQAPSSSPNHSLQCVAALTCSKGGVPPRSCSLPLTSELKPLSRLHLRHLPTAACRASNASTCHTGCAPARAAGPPCPGLQHRSISCCLMGPSAVHRRTADQRAIPVGSRFQAGAGLSPAAQHSAAAALAAAGPSRAGPQPCVACRACPASREWLRVAFRAALLGAQLVRGPAIPAGTCACCREAKL